MDLVTDDIALLDLVADELDELLLDEDELLEDELLEDELEPALEVFGGFLTV